MLIRPFRQDDTLGVVDTVRSVFDEYMFQWDTDGYCSDLYHVSDTYDAFWVVESDGAVVGCVGYGEHTMVDGESATVVELDGTKRVAGTDCELFRLYVRSTARGHALGRRLTETVVEEARARGRTALEFWSDKKLTHAHAMYASLGAQIVGERICPGDPDESPEHGFYLSIETN